MPTFARVARGEGSSIGYGVYINVGSATIRNSTVSGSTYGIYTFGVGAGADVDGSQVSGGTRAIDNGTAATVNVGASLLDGGADTDGTYHCVGAYDETYTALGADCQ